MRTKHTGARSPVNGAQDSDRTTHLPTPPAQEVSTVIYTQELSKAHRDKLKTHFDKTVSPFKVATFPITRKRKRTGSTLPLAQTDIFDERLSVQYEIKPVENWESLRRYKKFTVGHESITVGECILVKHDETEGVDMDVDHQWKAKVLEVRALDPEHVFIRIAWLNRPEDLASGRLAHHGKNELIPTNQMDIIDAMAVNGRLELYHWDEADDDSLMPGREEFFWRQTFDFATRKFSPLRTICVDDAPQNPDEVILQCATQACRRWMHAKCIAEDAVRRASEAASLPSKAKSSTKRGQSLHIDTDSSAIAVAQNDAFVSEIFVKGQADGEDETATTEIVTTSGAGERSIEDVKCLFCKTKIE